MIPIDKPNAIREMFDRICGRYDLLNRVLSFGADPYWRSRAVRALAPRTGESIIDLCCGTGDLSNALARAVGPTGRVVGVDFATQMLDLARGKFPNLTFIQGDACEVPLSEQFDHATLAFGPRNIRDLDKLWKEMQRLVRPGGRVLSLELTRPKGILGWFHTFYLNVVVPVVGKLLSGDSEAYDYLCRTISTFLDPQEMAETMRLAGAARGAHHTPDGRNRDPPHRHRAVIGAYRALPASTVIGLMSGTSADGVDAVKVRIKGRRLEFLEQHSEPIPEALRATLFRLFEDCATVRELARANVAVGELFARAALALGRADLIASHGQTVAHLPDEGVTLQIGEPAVIAARTGCLTVADFRPADVALGGQGAPLVPFFDQWILRSLEVARLAINLGGMANITWIPVEGDVLGWDTGPANVLMDALAERACGQPFDEGGRLAAAGQVLPEVLEELLGNPYFARRGPKSTGREDFGRELVARLWERGSAVDLMRTAAVLTAETVARALDQLPTCDYEVVLGGGGARNPVLVGELQKRLPVVFRRFDDFGMPGQAREAAAFALFGHLTLLGEPSALASVTGARTNAVLGKICIPSI